MPAILKLNKISPLANKVFPANYTLSDECAAPDGIMVRSFKMHDYAMPESLLCIARAGAGVNNIPTDKCAEQGIVVFNTPGANANAVKELVICDLIMCGRKISQGIEWVNTLKGQDDVAKKIEDGKKAFVGHEILGKTLGVIGMGAIGTLVANAAAALGMKVVGYDPNVSNAKERGICECVELTDCIDNIYEKADFITLHVPLLDSTRKMINADTLAKCKDGVNIINAARGELVDNEAIKAGLASGKVNRYVTDFPSDDVLCVDGIIPTPHIGASTPEAEDNCALMAAEEMVDFIDNGNIRNSVNYPALKKERAGKKRVTVLFKGADIEAEAKKLGFNDIVCAKRGEYGYAIIDCDCACKSEELKAVNGVIRVRVIG